MSCNREATPIGNVCVCVCVKPPWGGPNTTFNPCGQLSFNRFLRILRSLYVTPQKQVKTDVYCTVTYNIFRIHKL